MMAPAGRFCPVTLDGQIRYQHEVELVTVGSSSTSRDLKGISKCGFNVQRAAVTIASSRPGTQLSHAINLV